MKQFKKIEIKRKDIDNIYRRNLAKNSFRARQLAGKRSTIDAYTGKRIFIDRSKHRPETTIQVDHVTTLKVLIDRYKEDIQAGNLTIQDLREIANQDYNLVLTQERLNKSKLDSLNYEYLLKQLKKGKPADIQTTVNMLYYNVNSEARISIDIIIKKSGHQLARWNKGIRTPVYFSDFVGDVDIWKKVKPNLGAIHDQSMHAGIVIALETALIEGYLVAKEEHSPREALAHIGKAGATAYVSSYSLHLITDTLKKSGKVAGLSSVASLGAQQMALAASVGNTLEQYFNNEMDGQACVTAIAINAAGTYLTEAAVLTETAALTEAAALTGAAMMMPLLIGYVVATVHGKIVDFMKGQRLRQKELQAFDCLLYEVEEVLHNQKVRLEAYLAEKKEKHRVIYEESFSQIIQSALANDNKGIAKGIERLLQAFDGQVAFASELEFDEFFHNDEAIFKL